MVPNWTSTYISVIRKIEYLFGPYWVLLPLLYSKFDKVQTPVVGYFILIESSLKLEPFADRFARAHLSVGVCRRIGNVSLDLSLIDFLYNTNFMNKLKFKKKFKLKTKNISSSVQFFFNLQNHPTFHSEQRLVNLERGRECFDGLSILLS